MRASNCQPGDDDVVSSTARHLADVAMARHDINNTGNKHSNPERETTQWWCPFAAKCSELPSLRLRHVQGIECCPRLFSHDVFHPHPVYPSFTVIRLSRSFRGSPAQ